MAGICGCLGGATEPPAVIESMATRLPVIATRVGGNPELIESGMTGCLVQPANREALADAILYYLSERTTARRHAKAAQRIAQARFSLTRMVADYVSLYERELATAGVAVPSGSAEPLPAPPAPS